MTLSVRSEWLAAFVAVIDAHSFTGAARRIHRTQSAVSMQIRQLEEATGRTLLIRAHGDVMPTDAGERLLPHARRAVEALMDAAGLFTVAEEQGPLRLGIPEEYSGNELPRLLSRFQRDRPRVELLVQCASSDRLAAALDGGDLDLALIVADRPQRTGELLMEDPTWWVKADALDLPAEEALPLVLFDQACWWRQWALERVHESGRQLRITYTSDSITGVAAALRAGLGIGVLGRSTLPPEVGRVPASAALPDLPGSHVLLRIRNPDAPGLAAMDGLIRNHFTGSDTPIGP